MASWKGLAFSLVIIGVGLALAHRYADSKLVVAIISIASIIAVMATVNRMEKTKLGEIVISGSILTVIDAYAFLIQPNWTNLPAIPHTAELFFGVAIAARAVLLAVEYIDNPAKNFVKTVVGR